MRTEEIAIHGMGCGHCADKIHDQLRVLEGVKVDFVRKGLARVTYQEALVTRADLDGAITKAGYKVKAFTLIGQCQGARR